MELPSCPVCLDPYDLERHRPKNLPCGHSVCLQCLQNPGFIKFCPKDRKGFSTQPSQLPDNFTVIDLITQGVVSRRPVVAWCRDCDKESTDDCLDAGHRQCSQRQRRAERLEPVVELLRRGVAVRAQFDHHFEQVEAGVQRELKNRRATLTQLAEALSSLEAAGGEAALPAAEQLAQCVPQLEEGAALLDFEGHCRIELEDEDGSYGWSGSVALESNRWRALRHALLQLQANGQLTQTGLASRKQSESSAGASSPTSTGPSSYASKATDSAAEMKKSNKAPLKDGSKRVKPWCLDCDDHASPTCGNHTCIDLETVNQDTNTALFEILQRLRKLKLLEKMSPKLHFTAFIAGAAETQESELEMRLATDALSVNDRRTLCVYLGGLQLYPSKACLIAPIDGGPALPSQVVKKLPNRLDGRTLRRGAVLLLGSPDPICNEKALAVPVQPALRIYYDQIVQSNQARGAKVLGYITRNLDLIAGAKPGGPCKYQELGDEKDKEYDLGMFMQICRVWSD